VSGPIPGGDICYNIQLSDHNIEEHDQGAGVFGGFGNLMLRKPAPAAAK
jgi:hypothetical protein